MTDTDSRMTRKIVFFGATASLIARPPLFSGKFNAGTCLGIRGFEFRGRFLPTLFLSLARK